MRRLFTALTVAAESVNVVYENTASSIPLTA